MTRWYTRIRWLFWSSWMCAAFWSLSQWRTPTTAGTGETITARFVLPRHAASVDSALPLLKVLLERMPFDNAELLAMQSEAEQSQMAVAQLPSDTGSLVLRGIAQGAITQAIIDGLPGMDHGRAMLVGESVGDVSLLAVGGDSAVVSIRGKHTTVFLKRAIAVSK